MPRLTNLVKLQVDCSAGCKPPHSAWTRGRGAMFITDLKVNVKECNRLNICSFVFVFKFVCVSVYVGVDG